MDYFEEPKIYTVSQVTSIIKTLIEFEPELMNIIVEGEVSNWKLRGPHAYFLLKDEDAVINCVMFGAAYRTRNIEDGYHVRIFGRIGVYEKRGQYQLYCDQIQLISRMGLLYQRFEQLKNKLAKEGIFNKSKKKIPQFPKRIGIITSRDSAAFQDILRVISKKYPLVELYLFHTSVQGKEAVLEISQALKAADDYSLDLLILARGGGSIEDLWAFNEEEVVRSAFNLKTPLITGVGHEIDRTLVDLVADKIAPTPTGAANAAVPDSKEIIYQLGSFVNTMVHRFNAKTRSIDSSLEREYKALKRNSPNQLLLKKAEELENKYLELNRAFERKILNLTYHLSRNLEILRRIPIKSNIQIMLEKFKDRMFQVSKALGIRLVDLEKTLSSLNKNLMILRPTKPLEKGFAIVRKNGKIASATKLSEGDLVTIEFKDGIVESLIEKIMRSGRQRNALF